MQLTSKRDLGIHTEMFGEGILTLVESGAVTNRRKNHVPGKRVATFALGSAKLYRFMGRNPALEIRPADFNNDPPLPGLAKGNTVSRIVPTLTSGTHVTTSKSDVDDVITEYLVARLRGKSASQRAAALIAIAHPDSRAELTRQASRTPSP